MTMTIETAGAELIREMDALAEQQKRVAQAKIRVMDLMLAEGVKTARVEGAQVQVVETPEWEYRDRGVTTARADVERAERAVKAAKAVLKGAQDAAKAAGGARARVTETLRSVRVVRTGGASGVV